MEVVLTLVLVLAKDIGDARGRKTRVNAPYGENLEDYTGFGWCNARNKSKKLKRHLRSSPEIRLNAVYITLAN